MEEFLSTTVPTTMMGVLGATILYGVAKYMPGLQAKQNFDIDPTPTAKDIRNARLWSLVGAAGGTLMGIFMFTN
ncbi:MAG TPA: hypothetical protein PKU78_02270 [Candidatus Dojkabacteria bacterium]|nr:hypothetical protein [Candidatus Dojkabacteria bacterium]HRO65022.1 hypothetical protein [Candidatus Dojkabacteria bacterium]HRP36714.1 hypothetical protein [Candidatus Dojkabacteria bacterium]HRP51461.1 hypothetical protein [Candidatus Dojkabacteria bacterium]